MTKKHIVLALSIMVVLGVISVIPSLAQNDSVFKPISSGDIISWEVLDTNETNNIVEPVEWWRMSDFAFLGEYQIYIGERINLTVDDPAASNGTLEIGNLTVTSFTRDDAGFNLNLITGPAWFPYNYAFDPSFISSTNWAAQLELANDSAVERNATMLIESSYMMFLGENRSVFSFNYTTEEGLTSNTTYDAETGVLLYFYYKFELSWLKITIDEINYHTPGIPAFESIFSVLVITAIVLVTLYKQRSGKITKENFIT